MNSIRDTLFNSFSEGTGTIGFQNKYTKKDIKIPKLKLDNLFKSKDVSPIKKSSFLKSENANDLKLNLNKVFDQKNIMKSLIPTQVNNFKE